MNIQRCNITVYESFGDIEIKFYKIITSTIYIYCHSNNCKITTNVIDLTNFWGSHIKFVGFHFINAPPIRAANRLTLGSVQRTYFEVIITM